MRTIERLRQMAEVAAAKGGKFACPRTDPNVRDNQDHYPLDTIGRARNALARVMQYKGKKPPWWKGSLASLIVQVKRRVKAAYPYIKVS